MIRLVNRLTEPLLFSRKAHLVLLIAQAAGLTIISFGVWFVPDWTVWFALVGFWSPFFLHTLVGVRERRELRRSRTAVIVTDTNEILALGNGQGVNFGFGVPAPDGKISKAIVMQVDIVDERTVLITVPSLPEPHGNQPDTETTEELQLAQRRAQRKIPWLPQPGGAHA